MYEPHDANWWREAVLYHVYPRSFQDSDGDGVGDIAGLLSRLNYLNDGTPDSLGVDAIWLSPVFPSPMRDFGYDVSDYCGIDPLFGDLPTFDRLLEACHARGVRVLLDFVLNHTSDQHPWFLAARAARSSSMRDWYIWHDPAPDGGPPDGLEAVFGGSAWEFDAPTRQYYLHSFLVEQPDLNWEHPDVMAAMSDVLRFWMRRGVDGFRLDAAPKLVKQLGKPRSSKQRGPRDASQSLAGSGKVDPAVVKPLHALRRVIEEFPGRVAIAEAYAPPAQLANLYSTGGVEGVHLAFNFQFIRVTSRSPLAAWEAAHIAGILTDVAEALPPGALACYAFSNHDVPRFRSRHDADGWGVARARAAALLQLGIRGVPCIYYGDELGMADMPVPPTARLDAAGRDDSRTPMPWDGTAGRGFTTGTPWLPSAVCAEDVASEAADGGSLLALYRRALWLRRAEPTLRHGDQRVLAAEDGLLLVHRSSADGSPLLIAVNTDDRPRSVPLPFGFARLLLASEAEACVTDEGESSTLQLPALAAAWLVP